MINIVNLLGKRCKGCNEEATCQTYYGNIPVCDSCHIIYKKLASTFDKQMAAIKQRFIEKLAKRIAEYNIKSSSSIPNG